MDPVIEKLKSAYDSVAYESNAYPETHPDRLAVVAQLRGLPGVDVERCRVLEIGCAGGGNLIPMAEHLPNSQFLGIDLSAAQIDSGASVIREVGINNVELRCQNLMDFPKDAGQFDYIIAHGVYSWVPAAVQHRLLEICRDHLSEQGLGYISYNTYPGWRQVQVARDMMLFHTRNTIETARKASQAREIVQFLAENTPDTGFYREIARGVHQTLNVRSDEYMLHDHMEEINDPQLFWDFARSCEACGLAYVGDAVTIRINEGLRQKITRFSSDPLEWEQYFDFLVNRSFRASVIRRAGAAPAPAAVDRLRGFYVAGNPQEVSLGKDAQGLDLFEFGSGPVRVNASNPQILAMLRRLCRSWPASVAIESLIASAMDPSTGGVPLSGAEQPAQAAETLSRMIETCFEIGMLELTIRPMRDVGFASSTHPRASRYARWRASRNQMVVSLRHKNVKFGEPGLLTLPLLDGKRDRHALIAEIQKRRPDKGLQEVEKMVESMLNRLEEFSMLIGNGEI